MQIVLCGGFGRRRSTIGFLDEVHSCRYFGPTLILRADLERRSLAWQAGYIGAGDYRLLALEVLQS